MIVLVFQLTDSTERVSSLRRSHESFHNMAAEAESRRVESHRRQRDARRQRVVKASGKIDAALAVSNVPMVSLIFFKNIHLHAKFFP
jgi:hypothetical protein